MAMTRRLRPSTMRNMSIQPLRDIVIGKTQGNRSRARFLLQQKQEIDDGAQAGWMGANAGKSAVITQRMTVCNVHDRGFETKLTPVELALISANMHISMRHLNNPSTSILVYTKAQILRNVLSAITSAHGKKYPLRAFVEVRQSHHQQVPRLRNRWWGQVIKLVSISGVPVVFLRTFAVRRVRTQMAHDPSLGSDFVLDGLVIGDTAFDFEDQSNLIPQFVVPITDIWSHCIVVPNPHEDSRVRGRTTVSASHLIFPVRREPYRQ
jgi:hypothetical protein